MKKFLILILSLALAFSTIAISACSKKPDQTGEVSSASTSDSETEESSSAARASRNHGTPTPGSDTSLGGGGNTSGGGGGGTSSGGGTTEPDAPYVPGEPFNMSPADTNSYTGPARGFVMLYNHVANDGIDGSNYDEMYDFIQNQAIPNYQGLSATDQAQVKGLYDTLLKALEACRDFKKQGVVIEFNEKFDTLPANTSDLKNRHVDLVNELAAYLDPSYEFYQAITGVENFAAKKAKIDECVQYVKDHTFERVIIAQDYNGNGIMESSVERSDSPGKFCNELTGEKKRTDLGDDFFKFTDKVSGSNSGTFSYSDKNNTNVEIYQYFTGSFSFTAPRAGTLTIYFRKAQSREYYTDLDGERINDFVQNSSNTSDEANIAVIYIAHAGEVKVTTKSSTGYYCAVKFSYPDLGD